MVDNLSPKVVRDSIFHVVEHARRMLRDVARDLALCADSEWSLTSENHRLRLSTVVSHVDLDGPGLVACLAMSDTKEPCTLDERQLGR